MPDSHPSPLPRRRPLRWLAAGALLASLRLGAGEAPAPPAEPLAPAPAAPAAPGPAGEAEGIDRLVGDALKGDAGALAGLRSAAPSLEDAKAMAILERVRLSGSSRNSAIAVCFLQHREAWVQRTAIGAIAKLGIDGHETLDLLVKHLESPSPIVAQAAAAALNGLRDARCWPRLIELLAGGEPERVRLAHECLRQQTNQTWPAEPAPWREWLGDRLANEEAQFARYQAQLGDPASGTVLAAIDGLASLELLRDQATAVLITLVHHSDLAVRKRAEQHLRQWTGTKGGEPLEVALTRAQARAVAPISAPAAPVGAVAGLPTAAPIPETGPGFFETSYGMVAMITIGSGVLATLLWFLRTPAGQLVQNATNRFTKRIGRSRVVVMISNGTKRFAKRMPAPMQQITKRIAAPGRVVAGHLAVETKRMLNPKRKKDAIPPPP